MADSDEFTSGKGNEGDRRLVRDLHRMYRTGIEDAPPLARIRRRLAESNVSTLDSPSRTPQQHDMLSTRRDRSGNVNGPHTSFSEEKTWKQRTATIAAALFVTLLVGSLIVVLTRAHQNGTGGASNVSQGFGVLSSIHMVDTGIGWAVTDKGHILRTIDGGVHWKDVTPKYPPTFPIPIQQSVVTNFLGSSFAWAAVSNADAAATLILRTSDGGQTWQNTIIPTSTVVQITFVDFQHGWILSKRPVATYAETIDVFRSTDGGRTWGKVASAFASSLDIPPPGQLPFSGMKTGLGFLNATTGWVTGSYPVNGYILLYATHDGGSRWDPQKLPLSPKEASAHLSLSPPMFFNATDGLLPVSFDTDSGSSLDIYVTHDGGTTWKGTTPVVALAGVSAFIDVDHGWASDGNLLSMTGDGGQSWTKLSTSTNFKNVSGLDFVSSTIGWAIASTGTSSSSLLKTVDGGLTWTVIS
jgi:photosystem II stability/assembly factor-like uncharacterized protein